MVAGFQSLDAWLLIKVAQAAVSFGATDPD